MNMKQYNTNPEYYQSRSGKGQFSTSKRVSTQAELNAKQAQQVAVAQSQANRDWLVGHGLAEVEADELFASA